MDSDCCVTILDGKVRGMKGKSLYSGTSYYKFCGIPYAQPPIGSLRFMPPKPPKRWLGTLDATKEKSECLQYSVHDTEVVGSEDCLYLNVFALNAPRKVTKLKSVLVQIYGGGHFWGSSSIDQFGSPDYFIDRDIIFVSFNYRLHVFGFLNLELPHCAGNMGLKDQNLALKWVKNNIHRFGGDPENITVHGVSSGASDVHLHMMLPNSRDLFHRGIMQCGYAINPSWCYQTNHMKRAFQLAKELKYDKMNAQGLLTFLKKKDAFVLFLAYASLKQKVLEGNKLRGDACIFYPTTEVVKKDAFLWCSPRELMSIGSPMKPLICSITATEGLMAFHVSPINAVRNTFEQSIKEQMWQYKMSDEMIKIIGQEIKTFYLNEKKPNESIIHEVIDIFTDIWYCEWHDWLDSISTDPTEAPVYVYYFDHGGPLNFNQKLFSKYTDGIKIKNASHGDDGAYFYRFNVDRNASTAALHLRDSDTKVIDNMTTLFTNFVKNGDPNDENSKNVHWTPHDANNPSYLHLDEEIKVIPGRIFEKRALFWHNLMKRIKADEKETST